MPKPADVLNAYFEKKYDEVIDLFKQDPDLVNTRREGTQFPLLQQALTGSRPGDDRQALLEYMVTSPKFDFTQKATQGTIDTNIGAIIEAGRFDLLKLVLSSRNNINPALIEIEGKLTFQLANESLARTKRILAREEKRHPNSALCKEFKDQVVALGDMIALLRDATILHALAQDDATLLTKLDQAKGEPTGKMGDFGGGKQLNVLVRKEDTNIRGWLKEKSETHVQSMMDNPNSFYSRSTKVSDLEAKKASIEQEYLRKKVGIFHEGMAKDARILEDLDTRLSDPSKKL